MDSKEKKGKGVNRGEIESAIAKAVELRALHAALIQTTSPSHLTFQSSSPASHFSAQDYPVFTPSYEDEPLPGYNQFSTKSQILSETWDDLASRNGLESHIGPADQKSVTSSSANQITVLQTSPKSRRRNSLGEFKSIISTEEPDENSIKRNSNIVVPLTDSHSSIYSRPKHRGGIISRLFPKFNKKRNKGSNSPNRTESEEVSQIFKDFGGFMSIETLKRELNEANKRRDAALMEVLEMKSTMEDLNQKLVYLETYCEELKRGLKQTTQSKDSNREKIKTLSGQKSSMPVSEEVMVEGFLQIVSEARLSMKQFCKSLVEQIDENDNTLTENLKLLLQPYTLSSSTSKYSKTVLYHLEAIINQTLYQDFENSIFQQNGSPKILDPQLDREAQFLSFVSLRNLSWNEVLRKGTKYHSEDFSKFCDQKMSLIITTLNWTKPWSEQLLQTFFVAAKCIWLLHLLAFSFDPPLKILRVDENGRFDSHYMEDMFFYKQQGVSSRVKIMVMPGFYVQDRVLKCKVLCKYKSLA